MRVFERIADTTIAILFGLILALAAYAIGIDGTVACIFGGFIAGRIDARLEKGK